MVTDEYGNEVDEGYPIRSFESDIRATDWSNTFGFPELSDSGRNRAVSDSLKTEKGKKCFYDFLKTMNFAPSLKELTKEADEDVHSLLVYGGYLDGFIMDLVNIASPIDNSPEKEAARKTLEGLVKKGYPRAQLLYGELLINEGNVNKAHDALLQVDGNPYATETESDEATRLRIANPRVRKKSIKEVVRNITEQPKEPSFMEFANSAKHLDDVEEKDLSNEMAEINKHIVDKFYDKPLSEYKPEDVKALETLSGKRNPLAQQYLVSYYSEKGQFSKAFSMAEDLRMNPYAADHQAEHAQKMSKELLPLARKEQALKNEGR